MIEWLLGCGLVGVSGAFVGLSFLNRKDNRELVAAAALLNDERKLTAQYKSERDIAVTKNTGLAHELEQEHALRVSAEAQRDEAERRVRTYLSTAFRSMSQKEIDEAVADLFRRNPHGVSDSKAEAAPTGPDGLIDPFADVHDPAVPR